MFSKSESCKTSCLNSILLGVIIVLNAFGLYLLMGNSVNVPSISVDPVGIKKAMLELEYQKVGGKANYDIIAQATAIQMKEQIPQMEQYIKTKGGNTQGTTTTAPTPAQASVMSEADIKAVLASATLEGNKNAEIVAIEYSDMECPFCIRQYHDTKLGPTLISQYGDKVAFAFKNNRGVNHTGTEAKALAALCAKQVGGDNAYISYYHAIMDGTSQSQVFSVAKLPEITKTLKLDAKKWQTCVDTKSTLAQFEAESSEARKYNLNGTPGTLLLNVKTGKYATVEGAYPISEFTQKIESIK